MNFKLNGTSWKLDALASRKALRIAIALVLSNLFFYLLFSEGPQPVVGPHAPEGWILLKVEAQFRTPFQKGKEIMLHDRKSGTTAAGLLESQPDENDGMVTLWVSPQEAPTILARSGWEIIPKLEKLKLAKKHIGVQHEIHY